MKRWIKYARPGQYRGEGEWLPVVDASRASEPGEGVCMAEVDFLHCAKTGYLPVHEGDEPPDQFAIVWLDHKSEPKAPANPEYPEGIDVEATRDAGPSCMTPLPYPARRCGVYIIQCLKCGTRVACTTAGRLDDPRSMRFSCTSPASRRK